MKIPKFFPKYRLMVSHDCGCSYFCEMESRSLRKLKKRGEALDEQMLRWSIEREKGRPFEFSRIHREIIATIMIAREKEKEGK